MVKWVLIFLTLDDEAEAIVDVSVLPKLVQLAQEYNKYFYSWQVN